MNTIISNDRFLSLVQKFKTLGPIVVVGDVGIDKYTFGEVRRISPEAPVPVLEVSKEWLKLGLAANISHNLKTLGIGSTLCGVIGNDSNASVFENLLEDENLKTWGIVNDESRPTIFKERVTTNTQQICRIDYESSDPISKETEKKLFNRVNEFIDNHSALILEDYAKGTLTEDLIKNLIKSYVEKNKFIAVDPGVSTPPLFYKGATLLKPNMKEAKLMVEQLGFKEKNIEKISEILVDKLGLKYLVVTLGAEGMAVLDTSTSGKVAIIPTVATEVFDVSGAGDTAISVLTAAMVAGASLLEAAFIGNCASGVVVAKKGTATVDILELTDFYNKTKLKL